MKKAKRNNNINNTLLQAAKFDLTYKGFALDHEKKMLWTLEATDIAIQNGNEELLMKFFEIHNKYPSYNGGVLHVMFLG